jgi:hypothetical protein
MIRLSYHGGLGNTLFQYCFARILHEKTRLAVGIVPTEYRQHLTGRLTCRDSIGIPGFPHTFEPLRGVEIYSPIIHLPMHNTHKRLNPDFEERITLDTICCRNDRVKFEVAGFFQRYDYFRPWKEQIRKWLQTDISVDQPPGPEDLVVYVQSYFNIGPDFFRSLLQKLPFKRLHVLVNDSARAEPYVRALSPYRPNLVHSDNYLHDFEFLRRAGRLVVAPSSFSWWAAWLSDANQIHVAVPDEGYGSASHMVADLIVNDEDRYIYHSYSSAGLLKRTKKKLKTIFHRRSTSFKRDFKYGSKIPVVDQIKKLSSRLPFVTDLRTFVETGTNEGETIEAANAVFDNCITIELSEDLHRRVSQRLAHTRIRFELGDSCEVLSRLTSELDEAGIFYLDAHFSGGETARGGEDVPLLREVALLGARQQQDVVIIDDASLFGFSQKDGLNEDWSAVKVETILAAFGKEQASYLLEHDRMILWREKATP